MLGILGVVKTHFYHIWVQLHILRKTKELCRLHAILADVRIHSFFLVSPLTLFRSFACLPN